MITFLKNSQNESRPNFTKTKREASGGFLPRPLLLRLRHPNSEKMNQPKFCGILSPENCFRKTSSALFQISSLGFISKKVRILYNEYRNFSKRVSECKMGSARSADPISASDSDFQFWRCVLDEVRMYFGQNPQDFDD